MDEWIDDHPLLSLMYNNWTIRRLCLCHQPWNKMIRSVFIVTLNVTFNWYYQLSPFPIHHHTAMAMRKLSESIEGGCTLGFLLEMLTPCSGSRTWINWIASIHWGFSFAKRSWHRWSQSLLKMCSATNGGICRIWSWECTINKFLEGLRSNHIHGDRKWINFKQPWKTKRGYFYGFSSSHSSISQPLNCKIIPLLWLDSDSQHALSSHSHQINLLFCIKSQLDHRKAQIFLNCIDTPQGCLPFILSRWHSREDQSTIVNWIQFYIGK